MRYCFVSVLIFFAGILYAQDLIYTVTALNGNDPSPLDSILVENVSNHSRILFGNLPPRKDYMINLTQRAFWGTTGSVTREEPAFSLQTMKPGLVTISSGETTQGTGSVAVYNLLGQKFFEEKISHLSPYRSLSLEIGIPGYFLVKVFFNGEIRSLKVQGNAATGVIRLSASSVSTGTNLLKKGAMADTDGFQYLPGDSIRISVFKKSYYAYPKSFRIRNSDDLTFHLVTNTASVTGISNAWVDISGKYVPESIRMETGEVILKETGDPLAWKPGDIFVAGTDTSGYLRKVIHASEKEGKMVLQTIPAGLQEVFVNKKLKMSTLWMDPLRTVSEKSSPDEISKAMTDTQGVVHPVLYVYTDENGQRIIRSPLTFPGSDRPLYPTLNVVKDFVKKDLYTGSQLRLSLESGRVSLSQEAELAFTFYVSGQTDEVTKSDLGALEWGRIHLTGEGSVKGNLALTAAGLSDINLPVQKLMNIQKVTLKFLVDGIPVWLDLICDVHQRMEISSRDPFTASWNFDETGVFGSGWEFSGINSAFTPVFSCDQKNASFSLTATGNSGAKAVISLFPSTEVRLYGKPLMSGKLLPFTEMDYFAGIQQANTASGVKSYLAWNSWLKAGSDHHTTASLDILGLPGVTFDSGTKICNRVTTWTSPFRLSMQTVLSGKVNLSAAIPLSFKVMDQSGLPVPDCTVVIRGDGTFRDQVLASNSSGEVLFEWTVGSKPGYNDFTAQIFNAGNGVISSVRDSVEVYDKDAYGTLTYDGKSYKTKKFGNAVWMVENLAYLPAVSSPTPGSGTQPYYYVPGYYGSDVEEAKKVPGYGLYGVMYNWMAATRGEIPTAGGKIRGICPQGWHIPGQQDWENLWSYLVDNGYGFGGSGNRIAKAMASTTRWNNSGYSGTPGNDPGSNNSSEFNGLPGGFRCTDALNFVQEGMFVSWWAAVARDEINGYHWGFNYNTSQLLKYYSPKGRGYFVRCVKD